MNPSLTIIEAALTLAGKLPGDVIEQVAQIISTHDVVDARSRITDSIPHPQHRSLCLGFFQDWRAKAPAVWPAEVAIALRTAACSQRSREADQSVEIVWTGPRSEEVCFRHTEQAILQVLNSAQSRILLVSYAVYSIPNIQEAVVRAAKRGVTITVVVETPDKLNVQNEYSTLQALGDDVARCSTVYYWPKENRKADGLGKLGSLHVKCAVGDGRWLFLSSANLTKYAFSLNMELGVLITGGEAPRQIERFFDEMIREKSLAKC
ncbi:MAG: DISARM system phospholipase D-like protein DrmC [Isosphaeraceae bacterium]|jgi:phosphatidylserine/phosphatidylglycerophosphate/cardiolipin synthase-like enzyme